MSQLVIHESSNLEETSSDREINALDTMHYTERMALSSDKTDQKIINLYKIRKAHERGIHLWFKNPGPSEAEIKKERGFKR